jgi:hypothetical protein
MLLVCPRHDVLSWLHWSDAFWKLIMEMKFTISSPRPSTTRQLLSCTRMLMHEVEPMSQRSGMGRRKDEARDPARQLPVAQYRRTELHLRWEIASPHKVIEQALARPLSTDMNDFLRPCRNPTQMHNC